LDYAGTKEGLQQRIIRALMNIKLLVSHEDDDDVDAEEEAYELERSKEAQRRQQRKIGQVNDVDDQRTSDVDAVSLSSTDSENSNQISLKRERRNKTITFSFKDVEDTICPFDGSDNYPIEKWLSDFEDLAILFKWNDMQKLVFDRKSLKGVAKMFVRGLSVTQSWEKLKAALKEEFSLKVNSADIHRKLAKKKLKKDESLQEYYLSMRELASQGNIDVESVIQYIIDGISDSSSKVMLNGARNYNKFRARLRTYEKMQERGVIIGKGNSRKESMDKSTRDDAKSAKDDQKKMLKTTDRCYNCGESGHKSNTCKYKDRGKKCFKCNNFGHESKNCPDKNNSNDTRITANVLVKSVHVSRMFKEITIENKNLYALLYR